MDLFSEFEEPILPFLLPSHAGCNVKWNPDLKGFDIKVPHGELFYAPSFFALKESDSFFAYLLQNDSSQNLSESLKLQDLNDIRFNNIKWKQDFIRLYGKVNPLPRLTSWYGEPGKSYSYSGINSDPNSWLNNRLLEIKAEIETVAKTSFNSVLLNLYRDGSDYLSWHADDEPELGKNPIIASVNFGAERDFCLKLNEGDLKFTIPLRHGSLLVMGGELQHFWQHSVPKRKKIDDLRINLTYRVIN